MYVQFHNIFRLFFFWQTTVQTYLSTELLNFIPTRLIFCCDFCWHFFCSRSLGTTSKLVFIHLHIRKSYMQTYTMTYTHTHICPHKFIHLHIWLYILISKQDFDRQISVLYLYLYEYVCVWSKYFCTFSNVRYRCECSFKFVYVWVSICSWGCVCMQVILTSYVFEVRFKCWCWVFFVWE